MEKRTPEGTIVATDEPGIVLRVVRMDNSDDAPVFGKMYHVYAEEGDISVLAYTNRFQSDDDAVRWAQETFPKVRDATMRDLDYARTMQGRD